MTVELATSQAALLELREEKEIVNEAYDFLDEKRLLLAAELINQLAEFERLNATLINHRQDCYDAMNRAVKRHGLEGLQVYPPATIEINLDNQTRAFMGVTLITAALAIDAKSDQHTALAGSPEALQLGQQFRQLLQLTTTLAAVSGNLQRLMSEYQKTERRARALENVVIPEIKHRLGQMAAQLEELEQEETIRIHLFHQA